MRTKGLAIPEGVRLAEGRKNWEIGIGWATRGFAVEEIKKFIKFAILSAVLYCFCLTKPPYCTAP